MAKRRFLWQLFPSYILIVVMSLGAVGWYCSSTLKDFYLDETAAGLESRARLLEDSVGYALARGDYASLDADCKMRGAAAGVRITVILPSGSVVCDSLADPASMESHADRPEVVAALRGATGRFTRYSYTLEQNTMYIAVPIVVDANVAAILRTSVAVDSIESALGTVYVKIALAGLVVAALAALVSLAASGRMSRTLRTLQAGAERFAAGDLQHRLSAPDSEETAALAQALNDMARQLQERMQSVIAERSRLEAVLSSMSEGVMALDGHERVISLNEAAVNLLGADTSRACPKSLHETTMNLELLGFAREALAAGDRRESEITLPGSDGPRSILLQSAPLKVSSGAIPGALVVFTDVTRLRRLERVRKDFVANVSHEIRTPITSIRGFVETLVEGGVDHPGDVARFLAIIAGQVARLEAIVNDLLLLSQVEETGAGDRLHFERVELLRILDDAVEVCRPAASGKDIAIAVDCPAGLEVTLAPALFEQAVVNLVDNAVKYSPAGSRVEVAARKAGWSVSIRVQDHGSGIAAEHLPRLFERFYRIDKARSRKLGGTGLGLSIVKHIVELHGGAVTVKSAPGKGSAFTISLPTA